MVLSWKRLHGGGSPESPCRNFEFMAGSWLSHSDKRASLAVLQRTTRFRSAGSRYDLLRSNATGPQIVSRRGIDTAVVVRSRNGANSTTKSASPGRMCCSGKGHDSRFPFRNAAPAGGVNQCVRVIRYLIDTHVVSEMRKPKPHVGALAWLKSLDVGQAFFGPVTFGEIQKGVELTRKQDATKATET
jgi:hypothetical protein